MRNTILSIVIVFVSFFSANSIDFNKINENTLRLFREMIEGGDSIISPMPIEPVSEAFFSESRIESFDSILYVGYTDPNETLMIEDTSCYYECNIVVLNNGVLMMRNSSVNIYGNLIAIHNGKIIVDSTDLRLMSAYEWQFAIVGADSSEIRITNSRFDYGGYPGYTFIRDNSSLYVENSNYTGTTAIFSKKARINFINVTGGGEYSARDSSVVHFSNVEYAMIHIQVPESSMVTLDFGTDSFSFVEHWEVTPSSPFVSGTGYTFIIDSSYCVFNPSCASFSELTVENSQCDVMVRFTQDVCDTISGLLDGAHYDDWFAPFNDRTIHLLNTTVTCWHLQMFSNSNIRVDNSIIGEFICYDSSVAFLSNSIHDGKGGPLTAAGHSQVFVSSSDIRATVRVRSDGMLVLNHCTVWRDFVVADSAVAVVLGTFALSPIRVFDKGAAIVAAIKSPATATVDENVAIIGDAYVERTPDSPYGFDAYRLYYVYYPIDTIIDPDSLEWRPLMDWSNHQVRNDTLIVWNTSGLATGRYFLKLSLRELSTRAVLNTYYRINLRENILVKEDESFIEKPSLTVAPNPFNSSCVITVPADAEVRIYDLQGRLVCAYPQLFPLEEGMNEKIKLDNGPSSSYGNKTMRKYIWTPDRSTASGIYLIKAQTKNDNCITKSIIYLR